MNKQEHEMARIARLRDNTLADNYSVHDIASAMLIQRIEGLGYACEEHGDDKRDSEDVYSGTGVDFRIFSPNSGETCGWFEVKSKRSAEWLLRLNLEHWEEYCGFSAYEDEPVFLVFALVDEDEDTVKEWEFVQVPAFGSNDVASELPFKSKGHSVVEIDGEYSRPFPFVMSRLSPP